MKSFVILFFVIGLVSCSQYRLVEERALPYDSVSVSLEESRAIEPQVKSLLINHVRQAILRDGTTHLTNEENAEAHLVLRIVDVKREIISTQDRDTARAENYDIRLYVEADLLLADGKTIFAKRLFVSKKPIRSDTQEFSLVTYQDMPYLTQQVAQDITAAITGVW